MANQCPSWVQVDGEWDFERFLCTGKARFEALYLGFDTLKIDRLE